MEINALDVLNAMKKDEQPPTKRNESGKKMTNDIASNKEYKVLIENLAVSYSGKTAIKDINMKIPDKAVTALIGPSGCGKTTLLRTINRMHDLTKGAEVTGKIIIDGENVYDSYINPILQRRKIGMVFQKPNPFPTMSIWDNVAAGLKLNGVKDKSILNEIVEDSLKMAYLWDEVKDELKKAGLPESGEQSENVSGSSFKGLFKVFTMFMHGTFSELSVLFFLLVGQLARQFGFEFWGKFRGDFFLQPSQNEWRNLLANAKISLFRIFYKIMQYCRYNCFNIHT